MLLEIANVLSSTQCAQLRERIGQAVVDGRESAGAQAARGKRIGNFQPHSQWSLARPYYRH